MISSSLVKLNDLPRDVKVCCLITAGRVGHGDLIRTQLIAADRCARHKHGVGTAIVANDTECFAGIDRRYRDLMRLYARLLRARKVRDPTLHTFNSALRQKGIYAPPLYSMASDTLSNLSITATSISLAPPN